MHASWFLKLSTQREMSTVCFHLDQANETVPINLSPDASSLPYTVLELASLWYLEIGLNFIMHYHTTKRCHYTTLGNTLTQFMTITGTMSTNYYYKAAVF